jgi:YHS domain-containing protein
MLTTIAALALGFAGPKPPMHCVATLEDITGAPAVTMEYGGAKFGTCCGGCDTPFLKDPKTLIAKAAKANKAIGIFDYDAVTGARIEAKNATAFSDYKAIRYLFANAGEKKAFDAAPTKYVSDVKSEAYFCPVMKHETKATDAGGYADFNGTRFYLCCADCLKEFKASPAKFAANAAAATKPLKSVTVVTK